MQEVAPMASSKTFDDLEKKILPVEYCSKKPYLLSRLFNKQADQSKRPLGSIDSAPRKKMIADITAATKDLGSKVAIIYIPSREELLGLESHHRAETKAFADTIKAEYLDSSDFYRQLSQKQIQDLFYESDGHWNQSGTTYFAKQIYPSVKKWLDENDTTYALSQ